MGQANQKALVYEQVQKAAAEHRASTEAGKKGSGKADVFPLYDPTSGKFAQGMSQDDISKFVGRSFAGTERTDPEWSYDWVLGPALRKDREDADRIHAISFSADNFVCAHGTLPKEGVIFGSHSSEGTDDSLAAVLVARRYPDGYRKEWSEGLWDLWHTARNITNMPAVFTSSKYAATRKAVQPRLDFILPLMQTSHEDLASMPHWYVALMATSPDRGGEGHCAALMRTIARRADADGLPCYLETSAARTVDIYRHFGFEVVKKTTLTVPDDEEGSLPHEYLYCMIRPPAVPSL
mmetsp:Transcript_30478/g.69772  ORF Transcript_30478/g.69772 Transcript_30478/m.69772 type:complete len:294 (+) Transcript_30478:65-946(+)